MGSWLITGVSGSGKSTLVHDVIYPRRPAQGKKAGGSIRTYTVTRERAAHPKWFWSTSRHRPHPALQSGHLPQGLRRHPRDFRRPAEAQERGLHRRPLLVQHPRRPLRSLPGRRHRNGGDANPGRRGADLRGVPWNALIQEQCHEVRRGKNIHEVLNLTVREVRCASFMGQVADLLEAARNR